MNLIVGEEYAVLEPDSCEWFDEYEYMGLDTNRSQHVFRCHVIMDEYTFIMVDEGTEKLNILGA